MSSEFLTRVVENPFLLLGLTPSATRREIEREGQRLLGMLALEMPEALTYTSPLGPRQRSPEQVREAMAELRDPSRRLGHELLYCPGVPPDPQEQGSPDRFADAFRALGWGPWPSR
jgi:hypothetical protein